MHGLNERTQSHTWGLSFFIVRRVRNRQRWHANSRNSNRDNIPVKRRDLFPASICQSWSRKGGSSDDHFSENACVQARRLLPWEMKPCKDTEAKRSADPRPLPYPQSSPLITAASQQCTGVWFGFQESLELGKSLNHEDRRKEKHSLEASNDVLWMGLCSYYCSVTKSCLTLRPHGLQHARLLSSTISQSLLKFMSIESVMPSNHLILCRPLLLLPSVFSSIRVISSESDPLIRWPKYWSFSFSISPSSEYSGLISFRIDWFDLLAAQGTLKSLLQHHSLKASWIELGYLYILHSFVNVKRQMWAVWVSWNFRNHANKTSRYSGAHICCCEEALNRNKYNGACSRQRKRAYSLEAGLSKQEGHLLCLVSRGW